MFLSARTCENLRPTQRFMGTQKNAARDRVRGAAHVKQDIEDIQNLDLSESMPVKDVLRRLCAFTMND